MTIRLRKKSFISASQVTHVHSQPTPTTVPQSDARVNVDKGAFQMNRAMGSDRLREDILFPSISSRDEEAVLSYITFYGEDLNYRDSDGNGPLHLCAQKGKGALVSRFVFDSKHFFFFNSSILGMMKCFETFGLVCDMEEQNIHGETPFHLILASPYLTDIEDLHRVLVYFLDTFSLQPQLSLLSLRDTSSRSILHLLFSHPHILSLSSHKSRLVQPLIGWMDRGEKCDGECDDSGDRQCLLSSPDSTGRSILHLVAEKGSEFLLLLISTYPIDVNALDRDGVTPIVLAKKLKRDAIIRILLEIGASDVESYLNLDYASPFADRSPAAPIQFFSPPTPNRCVSDFEAVTALELSIRKGHVVFVLYQVDRGVNSWCYVDRKGECGLVPYCCLRNVYGVTGSNSLNRLSLDQLANNPQSFLHLSDYLSIPQPYFSLTLSLSFLSHFSLSFLSHFSLSFLSLISLFSLLRRQDIRLT